MKVGVIGNLARDLIMPQGIVQMGGAAYYSGVTASRLGQDVRLITRVGREYEKGWLRRLEKEEGIDLVVQISKESTAFENSYEDSSGSRIQRLVGDAGRIEWDERFNGCDLVHVGPLFHEVDLSLLQMLDSDLVSLDVQGYIRGRRSDSLVVHRKWCDMTSHIEKVRILHAGLDEVRYIDYKNRGSLTGFDLLTLGPEVVLFTDRANGSQVFHGDRCHMVPAYPVKENHPTGAGDVYTMAFMIRYAETRDPHDSGFFASAAASLLVEKGIQGIQNMETVEDRMELLIRLDSLGS
jgi:sugar/nucleoside kinase (ribokinase family)